ncbi:mannose-P-dolichol utilization defect 1 protein-like [Chanos chanos]|uniref:Solute carrier family 66 member 3 n=1 Tax=Chanos chanos TaxID=29144 RepID=A0A6J2WVX9_CHACN|nr:mannose-P-dolichol utilization defect 1 protein-like [Chanos chanos]
MATSEQEEMSTFKEFLLTYFMPEKCYDHFFLHFNIAHVPCLKITLSKIMGIWIIVGTVLAPLPQIFKVVRAKDVNGLSLCSTLLELLAVSANVAYCIIRNFPIGAWGEKLFMLMQIVLLGFLIQHYSGKTIQGVSFLAAHFIFMYLLTSCPVAVVTPMQESSVLAVIMSRLIQAGCNYSNGHTGNLSAVSVLMVFMGSLALTFSSAQERGVSLYTLSFVLASVCSGVVLTQVLLYWSRRPMHRDKETEREGQKEKEE